MNTRNFNSIELIEKVLNHPKCKEAYQGYVDMRPTYSSHFGRIGKQVYPLVSPIGAFKEVLSPILEIEDRLSALELAIKGNKHAVYELRHQLSWMYLRILKMWDGQLTRAELEREMNRKLNSIYFIYQVVCLDEEAKTRG